jgi:alpha-glucosidase
VSSAAAEPALWWQRGVVYQIYPRSFMDSNGDGVGDLAGITARLDYVEWLGVDAIWISPFYPSPMADFGYDVANYVDVHPLFGTLADFDALLAAAHRRGLRVILDFVPNHTSDRHPWFLESRASRASPKRDWYLWHDPAPDGGPPNNWLSVFGGRAWEWDAPTGQYYYHAYLKEQPDLNWRNPAVRAAMLDVLRFWFDRGVDGFRIDALRQLIKDDQLRDNPPDPAWRPGDDPYRSLEPLYTADRPEVMDVVREWRRLADEYDQRVLIGELWVALERLVRYYGEDGRGLHLPFNFHLILTPWQPRQVAALVERYEALLGSQAATAHALGSDPRPDVVRAAGDPRLGLLPAGAWPNWVLGNHDRSRLATRVGPAQARVAAMLLLTLRGTPTLYQGDELGMHDVPIPPERVQDPAGRNVPGLGLGRDPERTPMQWSGGPGGGFTTGTPWLPLADDVDAINVERERADPRSLLGLYRRLIELRRATPALAVGAFRPLFVDDHVLVYAREQADRRYVVALNFSHEPRAVAIPAGRVLLSTHLDRPEAPAPSPFPLRPDEGLLLAPG